MERDPWYKHVAGPLPSFTGPLGVKPDGGGCVRGCGLVGCMRLHQAVCRRDMDNLTALIKAGADVNEVEAAGNTPLHNAAFEGWIEGSELLLSAGAKVDASNNAGDTPWHWAANMGNEDVMSLLVQHGATCSKGTVLVQEHVPKVRDFYSKDCWAHHPKPYADFVEYKLAEWQAAADERKHASKV